MKWGQALQYKPKQRIRERKATNSGRCSGNEFGKEFGPDGKDLKETQATDFGNIKIEKNAINKR